METPSLFMPLL